MSYYRSQQPYNRSCDLWPPRHLAQRKHCKLVLTSQLILVQYIAQQKVVIVTRTPVKGSLNSGHLISTTRPSVGK